MSIGRLVAIHSKRPSMLGCFTAACAAASFAAQTSLADPASPTATPGAFDPPYVLSSAISLPGGDKITSFDISFVDPVLMRYYLANRTSFAAIGVDTTTNKVVLNAKPGFAGLSGNND